MLLTNGAFDKGNTLRAAAPGDLIATNERVPATNSGTAVTLTGQLLAQGMYLSSAASAPTLTVDSAANILAALAQDSSGIQPNTSFRFKIIISTANAVTVAATSNTGVTVNRGSVPASSSRDFLITFTNGTPAQSFVANSTNGSAVISGLTQAQVATLTPGMVITNAVAGLQGATILSTNVAAGTVTVSANASSTVSSTLFSFSPVIVVDGL